MDVNEQRYNDSYLKQKFAVKDGITFYDSATLTDSLKKVGGWTSLVIAQDNKYSLFRSTRS